MAAQFYLKTPSESNSLIMMRIYDAQFKDGVFNLSTRERIDTNKWDRKNNCPKGNTTLNKVLLELETDASDFMRLNKRIGYTRETLRDHLNSVTQPQVIPEVVVELPIKDQYIKFMDTLIKGAKSPSTARLYKSCREGFSNFMKDKGRIMPMQFDFDLYNDYLIYLRDNLPSSNSEATHLKLFKRGMKFIIRSGGRVGLDLSEISYFQTPGVRIALSLLELKKVMDLKVVGFLNDVKWLFILQCSTGLRISDLFRIVENIRGNFIQLETQKVVGKRIVQPLTEIVRTILKMYKNKLPQMCEQDYREGIKSIYKLINPKGTIQVRERNGFRTAFIWEEISSHDAVRTFITLAIRNGMTIDEVALMVGKSTAVILKHYLVDSEDDAQKGMIKTWGAISTTLLSKKKNQSLSLGL